MQDFLVNVLGRSKRVSVHFFVRFRLLLLFSSEVSSFVVFSVAGSAFFVYQHNLVLWEQPKFGCTNLWLLAKFWLHSLDKYLDRLAEHNSISMEGSTFARLTHLESTCFLVVCVGGYCRRIDWECWNGPLGCVESDFL